jgi:asparagine synthase (glutamine-hydrolysing)
MPGFVSARPGINDQFARLLEIQGNRVLLSGTGGDEVLGGVPSPVPALADLLVQARMRRFCGDLFAWSEAARQPWTRLFRKTIEEFLPCFLRRRSKESSVPWLQEHFMKRQAANTSANWERFHWTGPLPSFQDSLRSVDYMRRQLNCTPRPPFPLYEIRYPYLDRDILEFLFAIPREQLIQPRQRRLLMRRALSGIVPDQILNRRRKAYVSRGPIAAIAAEWTTLLGIIQSLESSAAGFVDEKKLLEALHVAKQGNQIPIVPLLRTFTLETWLRNLRQSQSPSLTRRSSRRAPFGAAPDSSVDPPRVGNGILLS